MGISGAPEAVVSLYLQSGGAARLRRPPGVDLREALGGVGKPFLQWLLMSITTMETQNLHF